MSVQSRVHNSENRTTRENMKQLCGICMSPGNRQHSLNKKAESLEKLLQQYHKLHKKTTNNNALVKNAKNAYHQAWSKSEGIVRPVTAPPRQRGTVFGQIQNKENNMKRKQMETERDICVTPGNRYTTKQKANAFEQYIRLFNALHTKTPANQQAKKALGNQFRRPNSAAPAGRPKSAAPAGRPKSAAPSRRPKSAAPARRPKSGPSLTEVLKTVAALLPAVAGGRPLCGTPHVFNPETRVQIPNQQWAYHHGTRTQK